MRILFLSEGKYAHPELGKRLVRVNMRSVCEMVPRRRGNCYDNAVMENFFGHLKAEMYHGEKFGSVKEFTAAVDAYIDWYNAERLQLGLDGCTPMKYRDKALKTLAG